MSRIVAMATGLVLAWAAATRVQAAPPAVSEANSLGMRFVQASPGEYLRGFARGNSDLNRFKLDHAYSNAPNVGPESPGHRVRLTRGFEIAITEVTVGQFKAFVEATGHVTEAEKSGGYGFFPSEKDYVQRFRPDRAITWRTPGFSQTDSHPVVCVSWNDAQAFCRWLSQQEQATYRLPSEAEWEYACRAGTDTWYSWGNDPHAAYQHANVADGALEAAHPNTTRFQQAVRLGANEGDNVVFTAQVASYKPNPWLLHDMHGNVWEWCADRWSEDLYQRYFDNVPRTQWADVVVKDPLFLDKTDQHQYGDWRVIRGGAWTCAPASVRSSIRTFAEAGDATVYTGFRVVREAAQP